MVKKALNWVASNLVDLRLEEGGRYNTVLFLVIDLGGRKK